MGRQVILNRDRGRCAYVVHEMKTEFSFAEEERIQRSAKLYMHCSDILNHKIVKVSHL